MAMLGFLLASPGVVRPPALSRLGTGIDEPGVPTSEVLDRVLRRLGVSVIEKSCSFSSSTPVM